MARALTADEEFTVRELHGLGFSSVRIAELVSVDAEAVERWRRSTIAPAAATVPTVEDGEVPPLPDLPVTAPSWPPPADDATVWSTLRVRTVWPHSDDVRVREVRLWGRQVRIDVEGDVWCPSCMRFRPVAELARPGNGCPVGVHWPDSAIWTTSDADWLEGAGPQAPDPLGTPW